MSREKDGFVSQERVDKKIADIKKLNPNIDSEKVIDKGVIVKLPKFDDEKTIELTQDQVMGFERYTPNEIELTDNQKAVRDDIWGKTTYKVKIPMTIEDLAFSLADTRHPVNITVLRNEKEVKLPPIYPDKDGMMGIKKVLLRVIVRRSGNDYEVSILVDSIGWILIAFLAVIPYSVEIKISLSSFRFRKVLLDILVLNWRNPFIQVLGLLFNNINGCDRVLL